MLLRTEMLRFDEPCAAGLPVDHGSTIAPLLRQIQRAYPQIYLACHVRHVRPRRAPEAVSERDAGVLGHLDEGVPMTTSSLARHMGIGLPTISEAIDDLEVRGLVSRRRSARDRSALELRITARGSRALAASSVLDGERLAAVLARLSTSERADAARGLGLLARATNELVAGETKVARRRAEQRS